jgi:heme exporter protein A
MQASMTQASGALLEVTSLDLWRGDRHVLRNISFAVGPRQFMQLVGPNGVGKTSLLRVICGLLPPENGEILWRGRSIDGGSSRERYHGELAYLAHANALKGDLTAEENLHYGVEIRHSVEPGAYLNTLEALSIARCAPLPGRVLSAGQRRRLALARVLMSGATLWVLDEPTTNLDMAGFGVVEACISEHLDAGGCVLAAAHHRLLSGDSRALALELD